MNNARTLSIATCALALALTQAVDPSHANACVALTCKAGAILPAQGELPANAVEVLWRRPRVHNAADPAAPAATAHLYRVEGNARVELEITTEVLGELVHVKPRQPVPTGSELVFEYDETCGFPTAPGSVSTSFRVGPEATPPTEVGALRAEIKQGSVTISSSMCGSSIAAAYADLTLVLSDAARPYADSFRHQLVVDGKSVQSYGFYHGPYSEPAPIGASILGAGKDRLFVRCEGSDEGSARPGEVAEGVHRVQFEVLLPDDTRIATPAVEIDLRCEDSPRERSSDSGSKYDAGKPESARGSGGDTAADGGTDTAENAVADLEANDDSAPSATTTGDEPSLSDAEEISGEDGCSLAPGARTSSSLWLVLLGLFGAALRRSSGRVRARSGR